MGRRKSAEGSGAPEPPQVSEVKEPVKAAQIRIVQPSECDLKVDLPDNLKTYLHGPLSTKEDR